MRQTVTAAVLLTALAVAAAPAAAEGIPWRFHAAPFDFLFGNHIDTHQQTRLTPGGELAGVLYVRFTGEMVDGFSVAHHANCDHVPDECTVGWTWRGVPGVATFVYHEHGDHPLWLVGRDEIPQPGGYSHFHWTGAPGMAMDLVPGEVRQGYYLELTAKDTFVFRHGGDEILVVPGLDLASHLNLVTSFPGF